LIKEDIIMEQSFMREEGQGLVEYALILVLVAIVVIAILLQLGPVVGNVFSNVVAALTTAGSGGGQQITFVGTPSVTKTGNIGCTYTATSVRVSVTQDGNPVSGASISGSVTVRDNDGNHIVTFSIGGTTGGSGQAFLSGSISNSSCGGQQATVSVSGGPSQTVPIP
jgi:pilus assembly protein Flp/PilA